MTIKDIITNFINRNFRDEIIDIDPPREWWVEYKDIGRRLEGYVIPVLSKYRGKYDEYSIIDNDHFHLISPQRAWKNAMDFYNKTCKKIAEHQKSKTNEK